MAHLIWSPQAADDLEAICQYIARDSESYAADFARRVVTATETLARFPRLGRVVPDFGDDALRELIVGYYRIIYEVGLHDRVELLTIHHSATPLSTDPRDP